MDQLVYRPRDAVLVIIGAGTILLGTASVVLSPSVSSVDPMRELGQSVLLGFGISLAGVTCMAIGLIRAFSQLPSRELPSIGLLAGLGATGAIGLFLGASTPLGWIGFYQQSDPRSQPSHVFGAILFTGSFASVAAVVGTAMLVSRLVRIWGVLSIFAGRYSAYPSSDHRSSPFFWIEMGGAVAVLGAVIIGSAVRDLRRRREKPQPAGQPPASDIRAR